MAINVSVSSQSPDAVRAGMLVVPVFADRVLGPGAEVVERALGGGLDAFMTEAGFAGKPGETIAVPARGLGGGVALLVGLGAQDDVDLAVLRRAAAAAARRATKVATIATTLASAAPASIEPADAAYAVAEGLTLGAYQYLAYKTKGEATKLRRAVLLGVEWARCPGRGGARSRGDRRGARGRATS